MKLKEYIVLLIKFYTSLKMDIIKYMEKDNHRINFDEEISVDPDDENCAELEFEEDIDNSRILNYNISKYGYIKPKWFGVRRNNTIGWFSNYIIKTKTQTIYFIHHFRGNCPSPSESLLFLLENNFMKLFTHQIIKHAIIGCYGYLINAIEVVYNDCSFYEKPNALYNLLNFDSIKYFECIKYKERYKIMYENYYNSMENYDFIMDDIFVDISLECITGESIDTTIEYLNHKQMDCDIKNQFIIILLNYKNKHIGYNDTEMEL